MVVVRIFDHRHAADRRVERFRDERHGPLLHLLHKGMRSDTSKATIAPFVPGVWPIFVVVMAVVAHMQAKHVFIVSAARPMFETG